MNMKDRSNIPSMPPTPFFSMIFPVFNVEKYLEQAVRSILVQSFEAFEIILVDDGSLDNSGCLCDKLTLEDSRIRVIHQPNRGLSGARNTGLRNASGKYVCFIDSDDYWDDNEALQKLKNVIELTNADIVNFGLKFLNLQTQKITEPIPVSYEGNAGLLPEEILLKQVQHGHLKISACLKAICYNYLVNNELFFKEGIKSEDIEWAIRLFSLGPTQAFLPDNWYVYRTRQMKSITGTIDYSHLCQYCDTLESSFEHLEKKSPPSIARPLRSYLVYQAVIAIAHTNTKQLTTVERCELNQRLRKIIDRYIPENQLDKRVKKFFFFYHWFGYSIAAKIIAFYLKHRKVRADGSRI